MRHAIYKSVFIVAIIFFLVSCDSQVGNFNLGYYVGVVLFNKTKGISFIHQYNEDGKESNKIKFSVEGMSYLDNFIPSDKKSFYVKSSNILSKKGKNYLIEVDKYTNRYYKINLGLDDIYKIVVEEDYIYITHSINKLSIYDKNKNKIINTISLNDYIVNKFHVDENNIYVFSREAKEKSYLNIINKENLEIIKTIDVTKFGLYQNDVFYYNDKIYFTNYNVSSETNIGKIGIYNTKSDKFTYVNLNSKNLDKILVDDENIYVTVKGNDGDVLKDTVFIIDRDTLEVTKKKLNYKIKVFDIFDGKMFILSDDYLYIYNSGDLSEFNKITLETDDESVVSGLIIYDY